MSRATIRLSQAKARVETARSQNGKDQQAVERLLHQALLHIDAAALLIRDGEKDG